MVISLRLKSWKNITIAGMECSVTTEKKMGIGYLVVYPDVETLRKYEPEGTQYSVITPVEA